MNVHIDVIAGMFAELTNAMKAVGSALLFSVKWIPCIREHDYEVERTNPMRSAALRHLHPLAGTRARCRRCGDVWDDLHYSFEEEEAFHERTRADEPRPEHFVWDFTALPEWESCVEPDAGPSEVENRDETPSRFDRDLDVPV